MTLCICVTKGVICTTINLAVFIMCNNYDVTLQYYRTCAGLLVSYIYAKLGGVVLFVDTHPSILISNQLTMAVKIGGRQQREENRESYAGLQVQYLQGKTAKLGGVVPYGTSIQSYL